MRKMRKLVSGVLAVAMCASLLSQPAQAAEPAAAAEETVTKEVDLSGFDIQKEEEGRPEYDEATKTIKAVDVAQFIVTLPQDVNTGETVSVTITGKNNGTAGFRFWLSDKSFSNLSEIIKSADAGVGSGNFTVTSELTSTGAATEILIKGASYGVNLDDIEISSIMVTYGAESTTREPKNPYAPEEEQTYDTKDLKLTTSFRERNKEGSKETVNSLLVAQRFIADPTTIEYNGRLYVYGTTDEIEFDGKANVISNAYNTHTLSCISTDDMVNWKDEGKIDVKELTDYAQKSWAPSIVSKEVNGKTKFFLYYTTGGDGIAVLTADSPTGPWSDPLGKRIIDRSIPTCSEAEVPWLFDPGVFIDDDGSAYIYFGGNNSGSNAGRVCKLNEDMISLDIDTMHKLDPYYYFEDNEINKIGDTYYYSYSTNWDSDLANGKDEYTGQACIAYYTADNPYMENWTYHGTVFANPGSSYGHVYNNHHHMFDFKGEYYISYHTTYLERALYGTKQGYRSLHIDKLNVAEDGTLSAQNTYAGVALESQMDGMIANDANIMSDNAGLTTEYSKSQNKMVLTQIHTGDWSKVTGVHFAENTDSLKMTISSETKNGSIEVYIDGKPGEDTAVKVGEIALKNTSGNDVYETVTAPLSQPVSGVHDLYFVYRGSGYQVASWAFSKEETEPSTEPSAAPSAAPSSVSSVEPSVAPSIAPSAAPAQEKVTVKKAAIKKAKNKKGKKAEITLKKQSGVAGYQVSYATSKKFKKAKTKLTKKTTVVLKNLKKKKYYIRVRAYQLVDGKKVYGKWSKVTKIKIKK